MPFSDVCTIGLRARNTLLPDTVAEPVVVPANMTTNLDAGIKALLDKTVAGLPITLQVSEASHILQWLNTLTDHTHGVMWVSFHQLLVDYQIQTGGWGLFSNGKRWVERPLGTLYDYKAQVQWPSRHLQYLAKSTGTLLETEQRKPSSLAITSILVRSLARFHLEPKAHSGR